MDNASGSLWSIARWVIPLVCGVLVVLVAARLGNRLIVVGTGELFTALALGALLRSNPWRTGLLLVAPAAAYHLLVEADSVRQIAISLALFLAFGLFNGAAAGAGAAWASEIGSRSGRNRPTTGP